MGPVDPGIINYGRIVDDRDIVRIVDIIVIDVPSAEIPVSDKCPLIVGNVIAIAVCHIDADSGSYRCPAVIISGSSPGDPSRAPFVTRNPDGSVIGIVIPAAIVKRRPSPCVIGNPGPSLVCIYPVSVCGIRRKPGIHIGYPDITVIGVLDPGSIRT
jgi:hypothetical protein